MYRAALCSLPLPLSLQVKSHFCSKMFGTGVLVLVPVPQHTSKATILVTNGKAKYDGVRKALVWKVNPSSTIALTWTARRLDLDCKGAVHFGISPASYGRGKPPSCMMNWPSTTLLFPLLLLIQIPKFPGGTECALRAEVFILSTTASEKKPWDRPPITMQFTVLQ